MTPSDPGKQTIALFNRYQRDFPVVERPYAEIAASLGMTEEEVLGITRESLEDGSLSRVGPVFAPLRSGASTLAALEVPEERMEEVAALVGRQPEVNHSYRREHPTLNLWCVVHAPDAAALEASLRRIGTLTGCTLHDLRLEEEFRIDLGFAL